MSDEFSNKTPTNEERLRDGVRAWRMRADKLEGAILRIIASTRSHIDGRDQLDELFPARWVNITTRRDGVERTYEGDWLNKLRSELNLAAMIAADRKPPRYFHVATASAGASEDPAPIAALSPAPSEGKGEDAEINVLESEAYKAGRDAFVQGEDRSVPHNYSKHGLTKSWLNGWDYELEVARILAESEPPVALDAFQEPETRAGETDWQNNPNVEIVMGEPWPMPEGEGELNLIDYALDLAPPKTSPPSTEPAPLFPPEPPPAATPEQLIEAGAINGEAYGLWRKMAKEPA